MLSFGGLHSIKNRMGPYQRTPKKVAIKLLDTQVFSGSVKRGSDRWRFLGYILLSPSWICCHQTFQVPKMEGFLSLIFGYFGGGETSLT